MADNLVCAETSETWLNDDDDDIFGGGFMDLMDHTIKLVNKEEKFDGSRSIPVMDFPSLLSDDRIKQMMESETDFFPGIDYLKRLRDGDFDLCVRNEALDWIWKACDHYQFGPLCICLSMNYLDRFMSTYQLPKDKAWAVQLLAVSCLSLAAKMDETDVPQSIDLQVGDPRFLFEAKTIQRMELLILNTLNWRLQIMSPFSFIDYFLRIINDHPFEDSISRSTELIMKTTREVEFLDYRPSEIAAAAAVAVSIKGETKADDDEKAICRLIYVKQERVMKCLKMMRMLSNAKKRETAIANAAFEPQERRLMRREVPRSPIGVLEATCLSYRSEDKTIGTYTIWSCNNTDTNNKKIKH